MKRAKFQKITPHDLRHTAASLAVSAGVNVLALQRRLGHKSAKVTLDTYADLFDTDLDAVANTMYVTYSRQSVGTGSAAGRIANPKKSFLPARTAGYLWRWRRDLNPRTGVTRHTLSRRAP